VLRDKLVLAVTPSFWVEVACEDIDDIEALRRIDGEEGGNLVESGLVGCCLLRSEDIDLDRDKLVLIEDDPERTETLSLVVSIAMGTCR